MSIKIADADNEALNDVRKLYDWVKNRNDNEINENQEYILQLVRLIITPSLRKELDKLKRTMLSGDTKILEGQARKTLKNRYEIQLHGEIQSRLNETTHPIYIISDYICSNLKIDSNYFSPIIANFLTTKNSLIESLTSNFPIKMKGDYKYKAAFEFKYLYNHPVGIYIKIFRDTTPRKLKEFIYENWPTIVKNQIFLPKYPHGHKRNSFRRDLQVYLLHLLKNNSTKINNIISNDNLNLKEHVSEKEENKFNLHDSHTRQIIFEMNKQINNNESHK